MLELPSFLKKYQEPPVLHKWSFSSWVLMKEVPYLLYAQEVLGIRQPTSVAAAHGLEAHKAIEAYIRHERDDCHPIAKAVVDRLLGEGYSLTPEETFYLDRQWRRTPERNVLTAVMDVVATHPSKPIKILDWKTGRRYIVKHTHQGQLYASVVYKALGLSEVQVEFHYLDGHEPLVLSMKGKKLQYAFAFWQAEGEKMLSYGKSAFAPPATLEGLPPWRQAVLKQRDIYDEAHFPVPFYAKGVDMR